MERAQERSAKKNALCSGGVMDADLPTSWNHSAKLADLLVELALLQAFDLSFNPLMVILELRHARERPGR
jgi:hypothetical protein